ncbi:MAG: hypothetical protein OCD02_10550 [Spirochaetaceae bacterium]
MINYKYIIVFFLFFTIFSCKEEGFQIDIVLPETSVVSSNSSWGVVKDPYVRVRKSADIGEVISSAFRQGDIVKILKSSETTTLAEDGDLFWFYTVLDDVEGWVLGSDLSIYESKEQATTASKMFK